MQPGDRPPPRPRPPQNEQPAGVNITPGFRLSYVTIAGVVLGICLVLCIVLGIGNVEITEYGLCASLLTRKVEKTAYSPGRYWIGPFSYFIKFPSVVRTIQFSDRKMQSDLQYDELGDPMLRSRTQEGLGLTIELSFQYQLQRDQLFTLYTTLGAGRDFHDVFVRIAMDRLTETATLYTANEFFVDRTRIGKEMEDVMRKEFEARLFSTVFSFQLRTVMLPEAFEKAIQVTEVKKQDVHVAEAEQNTTQVAMQTELIKAKRRTKVRSQTADGEAQSLMLANKADIEQYRVTQEMAADSYSGIKKALGSKEEDLLAYMQTRVLRDHRSDKVTVGLSVSPIAR